MAIYQGAQYITNVRLFTLDGNGSLYYPDVEIIDKVQNFLSFKWDGQLHQTTLPYMIIKERVQKQRRRA